MASPTNSRRFTLGEVLAFGAYMDVGKVQEWTLRLDASTLGDFIEQWRK